MGHLRYNHLVVRSYQKIIRPLTIEDIQIWVNFNDNFKGICLYVCLIKPIEELVSVSFTHYCASTLGLSTWWSPTVLKRLLVLRGASRLDAFSGYPFRTWLPGGAAGATTGTLVVRPSRSSRTRDSSSQDSYTHGR